MMSSTGSRRLGLLVAAACCATLAGCADTSARGRTGDTQAAGGDVAMSGDSAAGAAATAMDMPTSDAGAVDLLTTIDRAEAEAGRLAQEKARDPQVKAFAREMVQAHSRDIRRVEQLSRQAGISTKGGTGATGTGAGVVAALHASHEATMGRLRNLEGADFDSAYMSAMLSGHQQALDILQRVENNVQNRQLERHFATAIASVRQHLDRARLVQQGLSTPTGDTGRAAATDTGRAGTDTGRR